MSILGMEEKPEEVETIGASGAFETWKVKLDLIEVTKGGRPICEFRGLTVLVPTAPNTLPHCILGRDTIFMKYDITFREHKQEIVLRPPKHGPHQRRTGHSTRSLSPDSMTSKES